jgi:hypothetical protein
VIWVGKVVILRLHQLTSMNPNQGWRSHECHRTLGVYDIPGFQTKSYLGRGMDQRKRDMYFKGFLDSQKVNS